MSHDDEPDDDFTINRWMIAVGGTHFGPWCSQHRAEHEARKWNTAHADSETAAEVVFLHGRDALAAFDPETP